jgi:hypothetical protein
VSDVHYSPNFRAGDSAALRAVAKGAETALPTRAPSGGECRQIDGENVMATRFWTGKGGDNTWENGANWNGGQAPGSADAAFIYFNASTYTVTLSSAVSVASLNIGGTGNGNSGPGSVTLILNSASASLTSSGAITLDATNNGSSTPMIQGQGAISAGGSGFVIAGSNSPEIFAGTASTGGTLDVTGTINGNVTLGFANTTVATTLKLETTNTLYKQIVFTASTQTLEIGASANVTLSASGAEDVATGTIRLSGGTLTTQSGLILESGAKVIGTGTLASSSAISGAGSITASGGSLTLTGGVNASGATASTSLVIGDGSSLYLTAANSIGSSGGPSPTLTFQTGNGGLFQAINAGIYNFYLGVITGFAGTDLIEIKAIGSNDQLSYSGNTLTITNNGQTQQFTFSGTDLSKVRLTQTTISGKLVDVLSVICFMAGTMIRTPDGEVAVESLKAGDLVLTSAGAARPVAWLGRQTVAARFADPSRSYPIRVRAGALGDNVPSRDLLVSPDHALLVEGVLVHAAALVNDVTILRETRVPETFVYYHVELDDHSLILAENAPAETFVDNVTRLGFDNWEDYAALYPAGREIAEMPRPRVKSARQLPPSIARLLAERAGLEARDVA